MCGGRVGNRLTAVRTVPDHVSTALRTASWPCSKNWVHWVVSMAIARLQALVDGVNLLEIVRSPHGMSSRRSPRIDEAPVDPHERLPLLGGEVGVAADRLLRATAPLRPLLAGLAEHAGVLEQGVRRDVQRLGDGLQHPQ